MTLQQALFYWNQFQTLLKFSNFLPISFHYCGPSVYLRWHKFSLKDENQFSSVIIYGFVQTTGKFSLHFLNLQPKQMEVLICDNLVQVNLDYFAWEQTMNVQNVCYSDSDEGR